jgi:PPIC-type PPIASE domain/SurA N-terminal domain
VKSKRNDNIKNIKLTLLALIGATLLGAEAIAADPAKQDGTAQQAAVPSPAAQDNGNQEVIPAAPTAPGSTAKKAKASPIYAKVGNMSITWIDYDNEYASQARKKFYHAKPSEDAVAAFQRQIGDTLVTNAMLVLEAKRRKLKPDDEVVKQQLEQFERRFAKDPNWPEARARVLPIITVRMQNENLRSQLEKLVRNVPPPSAKQLRKYYAAHPEKFTPPPQQRVSTILLRMDPGAPNADWQKANEEAQDLVKRLRAGEDFAELARQYSGDSTAEDGGDMGYLHEGMLPGLPAETVSKLQPGETSDPVNLMEGVAIFRLTERKQPGISSFAASRQRAGDLWLTEQSGSAWNSLIARLKKNTPVQVDESRFLPLPAVTEKPAASMETSKPMETTKP